MGAMGQVSVNVLGQSSKGETRLWNVNIVTIQEYATFARVTKNATTAAAMD